MSRICLLIAGAALLLAGCVLPAPEELTFVEDSSGPVRLDGDGDLTVFADFTPNPDGPPGPAPPGSCQTNFLISAAEGEAADGCSDCSYTFLVDLHIGQPEGNCQSVDPFPDDADHPPYSNNGDFPGVPIEGLSIGVSEQGSWWNGDGAWSLWVAGEPGANSFDAVSLEWRNTGTNSWVREEINFSWTTAADE